MENAKLSFMILLLSLVSFNSFSSLNNQNPNISSIPTEVTSSVDIVAVGDIMMHGPQIKSGYVEGEDSYDFTKFFKHIKPIIENGDLTIANLETTLSGNPPYSGYPQFNSPDEIIDALKYAGFNTIITANNHSLDRRLAGLKRTQQVIKKKGLDPTGTFDENSESNFLIKEVNDIKIAIIAYTQHLNGFENIYDLETLNSRINIMDQEKIISDIGYIKEENPDFIIAYVHWGGEYLKEPDAFQVKYAKLLADQGVNIIIGSHPHVIQKSSILKSNEHNTYVFYSLGNFISNQRQETLGHQYKQTEDGVILNINIEKNNIENTTYVTHLEVIPTWVNRSKRLNNNIYDYMVLPIEKYIDDTLSIDTDSYNRMMRSYDHTIKKINLEQ